MSRPEVVEQLTVTLLDALLTGPADTTANEMYSAALTLVNRMTYVLLGMGADPDAIRAALNQIASQLPTDSSTVH